MRKTRLAALLLSSVVTHCALAGAYKPLPPLKKVTTVYYNCDWIKKPKIRTLLADLHNFHVDSIVYRYKIKLVFPDYVLFKPTTDAFNHKYRFPVHLLAMLLHELPSAKIRINGYSDNIMAPPLKKQYSLMRAQKLAGALWARGIPMESQCLTYRGLSSKFPVSDNRYSNHLADNRRVEVIVRLPH